MTFSNHWPPRSAVRGLGVTLIGEFLSDAVCDPKRVDELGVLAPCLGSSSSALGFGVRMGRYPSYS